MGHPSLTTFLQSATSREQTCTTIPPPSLADPGGGFDIANDKCPPDRGSSDCVTGSPASLFSSPQYDQKLPYPIPPKTRPSLVHPLTPESSSSELSSSPDSFSLLEGVRSIPIPASKASRALPTPPLTPEDTISKCGNGTSFGNISAQQSSAALDFLTTLFPQSGLSALPFAKSFSITSPALKAVWEGIVLDLPGQGRTLYVHGKGAEHVELRESIVALLDLADEHLECSAFVIALEKASPALGDLLHSLMYVGGTVVSKPPFKVDPAFVLVGIEI